MSRNKAAGQIPQDEHLDSGNCKKVMDGMIVAGQVVALGSNDFAAGAIKVGKGNILRIRVTALTYLAFGSDPAVAPLNASVTSASVGSVELFSAGTYNVICSDIFVRASLQPARVEIISD